jgi:hypothetical protein
MSDQKPSGKHEASTRVTIDGSYLRAQAREAVRTFMAPLQGVFAAASEPSASTTSPDKKKQG